MSTVRLDKIDHEMHGRPQKSSVATALLSAQYTFVGTTYIQVGNDGGYDLGNSPAIAGHVDWIKGSGTTLTLAVTVSVDGTTFTKLPVFATPSSGASAVSPGLLTYAAASWDNAILPLGTDVTTTHNSCPFEFRFAGYRFVKLWAKTDNASGTLETTSAIWAGTLS